MRLYSGTLFSVLLSSAASLFANPKLIGLPADTWYSVPNTKMHGLCPSPYVGGNNGCGAVITSWNGGVLIDDFHRMVVWGGGHGDYFGNEVYGFRIDSLSWELMEQPSRLATLVDMDPLLDGKPVSRHTYDGLTYVSHAKKMFAYGGSRAGNGYGTEVTWTLDMATKAWKNMLPTGPVPSVACCNMSSDYDPIGKKVLYRDPAWVFEYDLEANKWTHLLDWSHNWGPGKSVVVPKRRLFFTIGSGEFLVYDIVNKKDVTSAWKTTGGDDIIKGYGPGMAYDSKTDKLVAWGGGGVYVLDLDTKVWTRKSSVGAPATQSQYGTYGRFRYIQEYNVFILINDIDQDVYFYKLAAGDGSVSIAPGTGGAEKKTGELILDPEKAGQWRPMRVPVDESGTTRLAVYDTQGRVLSRIDHALPGRTTLSLPSGSQVLIVEASAPGMKPFRSLLVRN